MSKRQSVGEALWLSLYRANVYDNQAAAVGASASGKGMTPEFATRRWLGGMARHLKQSFPERLRSARERLGITQETLSEIAELSVTGLAMIERGERVPNLDTAARICWALDVAAGVALQQLRAR
jgi:DNA-binding XRE family transcriptional regulator